MPKPDYYPNTLYPKTLILGVDAPYNKTRTIESYFQEFKNLVKTNGDPYDMEHFIKIREVTTPYFLTKGKLEELKALCTENGIKHIIISERLSDTQERNLEDYLDCTVTDRTQLILEIFEKAAHSAEGKLQVSIAILEHLKPRLTGKGVNLAQQAGVIGLRGGAGETLKEEERRHIEDHILKLKAKLARMQQSRAIQRKQRLSTGVPQICLIGYTNAGKSTILNTLTKSSVLAEDKLFATLDTTTRKLYIDHVQKGLLSDTVGFIQQLPPHLIDAFKSTLSELQYADLLLQIIDISDANWPEHIKVVQKILNELGVDHEMLYVFNKADRVEDRENLEKQLEVYQPHVIVSATSKEGLEPLVEFLRGWHKR